MIILFTYDPFEVTHLGGRIVPPTGDYLTDAMADLAEYLGGFEKMELPVKKAATWGDLLDVAIQKAHSEGLDFVYTYPGDDGCGKFTVLVTPHEAVMNEDTLAWVPQYPSVLS